MVTRRSSMPFGNRALGDGVMHEPPGDVDLANGAARPRDHLGRQHGADAELLADGDHHGVHAGRVGGGELGEVADAHQHLGVWVSPPNFSVPLERRHEAEADRLEDRVDQIWDVQPRQFLEAGLERVEGAAQIGNHDHAGAAAGEIAGDVDVRAVDAEHQLGSGSHGGANLAGSKLSTLTRIPASTSSCTTSPSSGNGQPGRATDVDEVGARRPENTPRPRADRGGSASERC